MFHTDVTNGVLLLNAFSISDISEKIKIVLKRGKFFRESA